MSDNERPLAAMIAQGWEVAHYSATVDPSTAVLTHCFLMRKGSKTKIATVRKKMLGEGVISEEFEV